MTLPSGLPQPRRTFAVLALSAGGLLLMIDASIAAVVLPTLARELQVDRSAAVLVMTLYQLILAMTLMPLAAVGQRLGYRRLYQAGLALHSGAGLLCLLVDSLPALLLVRALQALASAAALSVVAGLLRGTYPSHWLGRGLALNTVANATGTALGPVAGGFILANADWNWAFVAATPFALLALLLSRALPDHEPVPRHGRFDVGGAALCALTFGLIIGGLEATTHREHLLLSLSCVGLGATLGALFIRHELRHPQPVLPINLFTQPLITLAILASFVAVLASTLLMVYMPFHLQHGFGFAPEEIGGMLASYAVASVMIAPLAGLLSDRIPASVLSSGGMVLSTIGLLSITVLPPDPAHADVAWRMWLCGAGFGLCFSPNARQVVTVAPPAQTATVGSLLTTSRMVGLALGATLSAALLALDLDQAAPLHVAAALTVLAGLASAAGFFYRHRATIER